MLRLLPLIFKNTLRNKVRSLLTTGSIFVSLGILGILLSMAWMFWFAADSDDEALRLITRNKISLTNSLPSSYGAKIGALKGVKVVNAQQWFQGVYKNEEFENFFPRFAADVDTLFQTYPEWKISEAEKKAFLSERGACVIGNKLVERFKFKIGDEIPVAGDIFAVDLKWTVRGIYHCKQENENLYFHYEYLRQSLPASRRDETGVFTIMAESPAVVPRIAREVDEMFRNSPAETRTETERQFKLQFLSYLGNVKMFLVFVSLSVMFMLILVSANTMALSVRERVQEIGVMKTLGFSRFEVAGMIVAESLVISLVGACLGLAFAAAVCKWLASLPAVFMDLKMLSTPPQVFAAGLSVAVAIGLVAAAVPALGAARKAIVDCLRVVD